ncbi:hypothetical protein G3M81_22890 [Bacillus paralicheniformis]|uniref:hypothetical protein n=1 Tax=Bacillus TaxID=1386 RepID=UPI0013EEE23E|nr:MULTISPECIES: hypothetical protein [Bacillus]QII26940.1 hypothetical protein G3M80_20800 [Bacillus altitudinis]QII51408.1 hypothetical protein G3M81_22890 [Bacillus paralicheniformis]
MSIKEKNILLTNLFETFLFWVIVLLYMSFLLGDLFNWLDVSVLDTTGFWILVTLAFLSAFLNIIIKGEMFASKGMWIVFVKSLLFLYCAVEGIGRSLILADVSIETGTRIVLSIVAIIVLVYVFTLSFDFVRRKRKMIKSF